MCTYGGSNAKHFRLGKLGCSIRLSTDAHPPPKLCPTTTVGAKAT